MQQQGLSQIAIQRIGVLQCYQNDSRRSRRTLDRARPRSLDQRVKAPKDGPDYCEGDYANTEARN